ncbi:hypothetical protein [Arcticibacter sp. MXS-1]|uniref:hypothetical protein n=1 Tax=Arcticibacter sp. MXS-1 TaxID=3341726 RepID=UPI0035A8B20D
MIRAIIGNDEKWRSILRGLNKTFYHQTVTAGDITSYISRESGIDFSKVFQQYLHLRTLPVLEVRFVDEKPFCRWVSEVDGFDMPVRVRVKGENTK